MKSKITIILTLSTLISLLTVIGCNFVEKPAPFPYDAAINNIRKGLELRIIDSTFRLALGNSTYDRVNNRYGSPILKLKKNKTGDTLKSPTYWAKHVHLDEETGQLLAEDDIFRSGKYKPGVDLTYFEELTYRYVFEDFENYNTKMTVKSKYSKGWYYIHTFPKLLNMTSNRPGILYYEPKDKIISEKEADSILKSWNLKRLNY